MKRAKRRKYKTDVFDIPAYEGETIEHKVQRIVLNKEPIEYGKLLAYEECHPDWDIGCLSYTTITRAQNEIVYAKQFRRD